MERGIEILKGKIIKNIEVAEDKSTLTFYLDDGGMVRMYHYQDCSEEVTLNEIIGDLDDLIDTPIIQADLTTEVGDSTSEDNIYGDNSYTWSFYKLATIKGYVTLRWYGTSNGYYSEEVDVELSTLRLSVGVCEVEEIEFLEGLIPNNTIDMNFQTDEFLAHLFKYTGIFEEYENHIIERDNLVNLLDEYSGVEKDSLEYQRFLKYVKEFVEDSCIEKEKIIITYEYNRVR